MNILISTITRNDGHRLDNYYAQVSILPKLFKDHKFYLSIYENDSTDDTREKLKKYDFSMFEDVSIICEDLDYPFFESVDSERRVQILAECRNKAIFDCGFLDKCDKVLVIESDIYYQPRAIRSLFNFDKIYNLEVDVVSSAYLWDQYSNAHYDVYGTRRTETSTRDFLYEGWRDKEYDAYWATFNGIVYMNAEAFKQGAKYGWYNERLGTYDCDTVMICEEFRKRGFDKIYVYYKSRCYIHKVTLA
jgi:hypothetical protein